LAHPASWDTLVRSGPRQEGTTVAYQAFDVQVPGGQLHIGRWGSGRAVVIAAHGLTGTHMNFEALADQLGDGVTLLAPDLRGRGRSSTVGAPYGMARHADDLMAVLDHADAADALTVGHSMGALWRWWPPTVTLAGSGTWSSSTAGCHWTLAAWPGCRLRRWCAR
jgi:pimeloyl-ACP methyl ester carboxylesterase